MINLNYRDSRPIYEQIMDGMRKLVISGAMCENEKLPSVRDMAAEMAINPNTIQRAYRELEAEGYIYSIAGKGSFVAHYEEINNKRENELLREFDEICRELLYLKKDRNYLIKRINQLPEQ